MDIIRVKTLTLPFEDEIASFILSNPDFEIFVHERTPLPKLGGVLMHIQYRDTSGTTNDVVAEIMQQVRDAQKQDPDTPASVLYQYIITSFQQEMMRSEDYDDPEESFFTLTPEQEAEMNKPKTNRPKGKKEITKEKKTTKRSTRTPVKKGVK